MAVLSKILPESHLVHVIVGDDGIEERVEIIEHVDNLWKIKVVKIQLKITEVSFLSFNSLLLRLRQEIFLSRPLKTLKCYIVCVI